MAADREHHIRRMDRNIFGLLEGHRLDSHVVPPPYSEHHFRRRSQFHPSLLSRLALETVMEGHRGCVNAIGWNRSGSLLLSGSDDFMVNVWDYNSRRLLHSVDSGHSGNIFCVRFMPDTGDDLLASGAGDNEVRVHRLSRSPTAASATSSSTPATGSPGAGRQESSASAGPSHSSEQAALFRCHTRRVKKLAVEEGNPHVVWSASEDATLRQHDLRETSICPPPSSHAHSHSPLNHSLSHGASECRGVLLDLRAAGKVSLQDAPRDSLALKSCAISPTRPHLLMVGGSDAFARIYDRRMLPSPSSLSRASPRPKPPPSVLLLAPSHLSEPQGRSGLHLTHVAFSANGDEALLSYSGEHVYLFDLDRATIPSMVYTPADVASSHRLAPLKPSDLHYNHTTGSTSSGAGAGGGRTNGFCQTEQQQQQEHQFNHQHKPTFPRLKPHTSEPGSAKPSLPASLGETDRNGTLPKQTDRFGSGSSSVWERYTNGRTELPRAGVVRDRAVGPGLGAKDREYEKLQECEQLLEEASAIVLGLEAESETARVAGEGGEGQAAGGATTGGGTSGAGAQGGASGGASGGVGRRVSRERARGQQLASGRRASLAIDLCSEVLEEGGEVVGVGIRHDALCTRAAAFLERGWKNDSLMVLRDCNEARRILPTSIRAHLYMAHAFSQLGKHQEAVEFAERAAVFDSNLSSYVMSLRAKMAAAEEGRQNRLSAWGQGHMGGGGDGGSSSSSSGTSSSGGSPAAPSGTGAAGTAAEAAAETETGTDTGATIEASAGGVGGGSSGAAGAVPASAAATAGAVRSTSGAPAAAGAGSGAAGAAASGAAAGGGGGSRSNPHRRISIRSLSELLRSRSRRRGHLLSENEGPALAGEAPAVVVGEEGVGAERPGEAGEGGEAGLGEGGVGEGGGSGRFGGQGGEERDASGERRREERVEDEWEEFEEEEEGEEGEEGDEDRDEEAEVNIQVELGVGRERGEREEGAGLEERGGEGGGEGGGDQGGKEKRRGGGQRG
ncbi:hypothetical protein CLOP_g13631 [Closterium sp. NIES-67]|nr:hypothetical protein CLOP_g13631 [Closterium sp. NIES-67]